MGRAVEAAATLAPADGRCRHCGLATPSGPFCCYGCELASGIASEAAQHQSRTKNVLTLALLLSMSVMMLSLFLYAEDVYGADGDPTMARLRGLWRLASAVMATPVVLLCGVPLARHAWSQLVAGKLSMELLVATGAFSAYALSVRGLFRDGGVYFDSATSALVLTTLGRYLEASARAKAAGILGPSLEAARTSVLAGFEELRPISPAQVTPGMRLRIPVDGVVPVDARVVGAPVDVNLGVLTGESHPRALAVGARVPAGAVPISGPLEAVAEASARDSTLERLAELSRGLAARRSPLMRTADLFAQVLTPAVWLLAVGALLFWTSHASIQRGVVVSLAVVLAACPCTFGIATPLVLWLALRRALGEGVLVRSAATLEALAGVDSVAFDKTGTLTGEALRLTSPVDEEALALAAALEEGSRHPVARAIADACTKTPPPLRERRFEPGGVIGTDEQGRILVLGSPAFLRQHGVEVVDAAARALLAIDGRIAAQFILNEAVRPEAAAAIAALAQNGVSSCILTGDARGHAEPVAAALGIAQVEAELSATDKVARLSARGAHTAMVGDGLNDAPALAGVAVSFAMEGGSSLARGMAEVTLLHADLRLVPWTIELGRRAMRLGRRNLAISIAYNLVFLGLALSGALRPVWAGLSMLGSSLLMLATSLGIASAPGVEKR